MASIERDIITSIGKLNETSKASEISSSCTDSVTIDGKTDSSVEKQDMFLLSLPAVTPSIFEGQSDPRLVKKFLTEIENVCEFRLPDRNQWHHYASRFLVGRASDWYKYWKEVIRVYTWDSFTTQFKCHFLPPGYNDFVRQEFDNIRCESSVVDYNQRFISLMLDVDPNFQNSEKCIPHYLRGLPMLAVSYICQRDDRDLLACMKAARDWEALQNEIALYYSQNPE